MERRTFLAMPSGGLLAVLGTLAVPRFALAQPARKVARIGILGYGRPVTDIVGPQPRSPGVSALLLGLRELGYVYGRDFVTEPRMGDSRSELWPDLAAELVRLQVDVIVSYGLTVRACKQATSTIPIVMVGAGDPVGDGLVQSLAHPGGNITGLTDLAVELVGKQLEMLKELIPSKALVAVIAGGPVLETFTAPARKLGLRLLWLELRDASDLEGAFKAATKAGAGSVLVHALRVTLPQARRIAELAVASRLPTMYILKPFVEAGGLISYSADVLDIFRRAAVFVDKILKGAKPGDLPVEQPTKFDLVINLKTSKALGLTIPPSLLLRADQIIE